MSSCSFPGCVWNAENNGYCIRHRQYAPTTSTKAKHKEPPVKVEEAKQAINKVSDKQAALNVKLKKADVEFLARPENKYCTIQIDEGCTRIATVVNHTRRRFKDTVLNDECREPSCWYCNSRIENKDGWARDNGHLKSKFTPSVAVAEFDKDVNSIIIK